LSGVPKRARREQLPKGVEPGAEATDWVQQEFASADLADKRLNRRLIKTASQLANSPASPINEACGDWASTQAAYRFFNNTKVTAAAILKPHLTETVLVYISIGLAHPATHLMLHAMFELRESLANATEALP
jgi:hypothetical protein